jgi:S1-C subfamily serine protease
MMKQMVASVIAALFLCVPALFGQKIVKLTLDGEHDFLLQEVGAIMHGENNLITITQVLNGNTRSDQNTKVDLQSGDIIAMVNGTHPKGVKGLRKVYDDLAIGGEFKLGVKRNGQPMIVTVIKTEAKSNPKAKIMTMTFDDKEMRLLPGIGVIDEKGKNLSLKEMPPDPEVAKHSALKVGDVFKEMNSVPLTSYKQFDALYEKIKPGSTVGLKITRNGKEQNITVLKPEGMRRVIINK